jgi:hypothetical protein
MAEIGKYANCDSLWSHRRNRSRIWVAVESWHKEGKGSRKPALPEFGLKRTRAIPAIVALAALPLGLLQRHIPFGILAILIARIDWNAHDSCLSMPVGIKLRK